MTGVALLLSVSDGKDKVMLRSGKQNRIEGQHLSANCNHEGNALNSVSHIVRPASCSFMSAHRASAPMRRT
jgi:hypothetical protein